MGAQGSRDRDRGGSGLVKQRGEERGSVLTQPSEQDLRRQDLTILGHAYQVAEQGFEEIKKRLPKAGDRAVAAMVREAKDTISEMRGWGREGSKGFEGVPDKLAAALNRIVEGKARVTLTMEPADPAAEAVDVTPNDATDSA